MKLTIDTAEYIIAFDPATVTGYAYQTAGPLIYGATRFAEQSWRAIAQTAYEQGARYAVVEDAFLGSNAKVYGMLKAIQGELVAGLISIGYQPVLIKPAEWKTELFGARTIGKELAVQYAIEQTGAVKIGHDAADAICLLRYAERVRLFAAVHNERTEA